MSIELTRVDFRLIHGQVITRWLTQCNINEIVTIDTPLSKDAFMQEVFKMAAPKGVKITIVSVEDAVKLQQEGAFEQNRVMVLFKGVASLNDAVEAGLKLNQVQIGGLGGGPGRKAVNNAITLDRACLLYTSKQLDKQLFKSYLMILHLNMQIVTVVILV